MTTQQSISQTILNPTAIFNRCKEEALERVQELTRQEAVEFLEYAAKTNPAITNAWLNFYEGKVQN